MKVPSLYTIHGVRTGRVSCRQAPRVFSNLLLNKMMTTITLCLDLTVSNRRYDGFTSSF